MRLAHVIWVLFFAGLLVWGGVRLAKSGADAMRQHYAPFGAYIESQADRR